jgi:hypothetical protein
MPLILSSLHSHHVSVRGFKIICNCWLTTSLKTRNHHYECSLFFIQVQTTAFPLYIIKSLLNSRFQLCSCVINAVQNRLLDWELIFVFSAKPCLLHCYNCGHEYTHATCRRQVNHTSFESWLYCFIVAYRFCGTFHFCGWCVWYHLEDYHLRYRFVGPGPCFIDCNYAI